MMLSHHAMFEAWACHAGGPGGLQVPQVVPSHDQVRCKTRAWAETFRLLYQWIGLRENLQENPIFNGKIDGNVEPPKRIEKSSPTWIATTIETIDQ